LLRLRPGPGCDDPVRSLRALLKFAWRACHLRALSVEPISIRHDNANGAHSPSNPANKTHPPRWHAATDERNS